VTGKLSDLTDLPVVRGENLQDATANLDAFTEVHGMLRALAVNMTKMVNDLRLLASDVHQVHELTIPARQIGSSIMPGKVNPVIPEYIVSISEKVFANDQMITSLCSQGQLDLNAYIPLIGDGMIESLELLIGGVATANLNLLKGITITPDKMHTMHSPSLATVVIPDVGYHEAAKLARYMKENGVDIETANQVLGIVEDTVLKKRLKPERLLELGYTFSDQQD
jgi:aspartate ammonia-lyase